MKIIDCKQGSREWWAARLGVPTVSSLGRILTEKQLNPSKSRHSYAAELVAERMLGRPLDWGQDQDTIWTERGTDMEAEARRWYEMYRDCDVAQVGFITTDAGGFGGSPDGLVGEDGLIEIKCRSAKHHIRAIMGTEPIAGQLQTQGYLWLTGREWIDVVAYNDVLPKKIVREHQIPEFQQAITAGLDTFLAELDRGFDKLEALGDVIEESDEIEWQLIESIKQGEQNAKV